MYLSMADRTRSPEVIRKASVIIIAFYAFLMILGYACYAQFSKAPITLNIGKDFSQNLLHNGAFMQACASIGLICNLLVS
jgi:hypothetical protein